MTRHSNNATLFHAPQSVGQNILHPPLTGNGAFSNCKLTNRSHTSSSFTSPSNQKKTSLLVVSGWVGQQDLIRYAKVNHLFNKTRHRFTTTYSRRIFNPWFYSTTPVQPSMLLFGANNGADHFSGSRAIGCFAFCRNRKLAWLRSTCLDQERNGNEYTEYKHSTESVEMQSPATSSVH